MKKVTTIISSKDLLLSKLSLVFMLHLFLLHQTLNAQTTFTFDDVAINNYTTITQTVSGETIQLVAADNQMETLDDDGGVYPDSPVMSGRIWVCNALTGYPSMVTVSLQSGNTFTLTQMSVASESGSGVTHTFTSANGSQDFVLGANYDQNITFNANFQNITSFTIETNNGGLTGVDGIFDNFIFNNITASTAPEIAITDASGDNIADGDALGDANATNSTDFGNVCEAGASSTSFTYTITNSGDADLDFTGTPLVDLVGGNSGDFSVTSQIATDPLPHTTGNTTTFIIQFNPTAIGQRSTTVSIANNDSDENPFDFVIVGTGVSTPTVNSIVRADPNPTSAASVDFTVTFSESVTGVATGDFVIDATGVTGATVTGVSGSGTTYTVTVNTGSGTGTLSIDFDADAAGGVTNGTCVSTADFTGGEVYMITATSSPPDIPTLSEWGLLILALLFMTLGTLYLVNHRQVLVKE